MSRALQPSTPLEDIEARRRWTGPAVAGVLTEDLADFCQSGVSVILGARMPNGLPLAGIALAARIAGGEMRIFLREPANAPLLAAFDRGSPIAATFSEPRNHRSIQIKGIRVRRSEMEDGDADDVDRQVRRLEDGLVFLNYTRRFAASYCSYRGDELTAITFQPTEAFVQTPGPGAGEQLA